MAITTLDGLVDALGNNSSQFVVDKASIANAAAGQMFSLWRATGQPAQAANPLGPIVTTSATLGAIQFPNQTAPATSYLSWLALMSGNSAMSVEIYDRIAHMGSLVFNSTAVQTVNLPIDLQTLAPSAERLGASNYSDVQWFLEVYSDGGATGANAVPNVTFDDGSSANLATIGVGGTIRAGRLIPLTPSIFQTGRYIRSVNSVTLSASTGTAGAFGFTCMRRLAALPLSLANKIEVADWAALGLPKVPNDACLQIVMLTSTTSTGTLRGGGKIAHG